jgi:HAMP domain-containing protein
LRDVPQRSTLGRHPEAQEGHLPTAPARRKKTRTPATAAARKATSKAASAKTRTARSNGADGARAKSSSARAKKAAASTNGAAPSEDALQDLLEALIAARKGDFSQRMSIRQKGLMRDIAINYNELIESQTRVTKEFGRLAKIIGREGRMTERAVVPAASGEWAAALESVNDLIDDLVRPTTEIARVMDAVADGDLTQKMQLKIGGQPVKGEFLRIGTTVNEMVDQLSSFADEVTRVAREVGTEGKLGGQATVKGVSGTWRDLTDSVNFMASNLTDQVRNIATVTTAVAYGDLSQKITVDARGEILELKNTINTMVDQLSSFADEVTRVAREVGTEGKLGGQAEV